MAKQTTGCLWRYWVENVWLACLTFALVIELCPGHVLRAADFSVSNSPSLNVSVIPLEYHEMDFTVTSYGVSLATQTNPFKKEPTVATGKTIRGVVKFDGDTTNSMAFIWQRGTGKLFLDLNRNQDLTDDSAGVFSCANPRSSYVTFSKIRLGFNISSIKREVLVDMNFYDYSSHPGCSMSSYSLWQGKATLQGQDWQVGIIPSALGQADLFNNSKLLLRPWSKRGEFFSANDGQLATVPFSSNCFFNDEAYALKGVLPQNNNGKFAIQLTEQSVELGELKITGQFINRLVLTGPPSNYVVILTKPTHVVKVPTGRYARADVLLEHNGTQAYGDADRSGDKRIVVNDRTPVVLDIGGPLTNSVVATRHGRELKLDYRLVGAGDRTYQLASALRTKPPEFSIFTGNKKLASGKFEFG